MQLLRPLPLQQPVTTSFLLQTARWPLWRLSHRGDMAQEFDKQTKHARLATLVPQRAATTEQWLMLLLKLAMMLKVCSRAKHALSAISSLIVKTGALEL